MTGFLVVACLLLGGALLFALSPLLRNPHDDRISIAADANLAILRDQQRELAAALERGEIAETAYRNAVAELQKRAIEEGATAPSAMERKPLSRYWAVSVGAAIPLVVVSLYLMLGNPAALSPQASPASQAGADRHTLTAAQITKMVEQLAARLERDPEDNAGWAMLARSYNALGRHAEAAEAYRILATRLPEDAQLLADYADALAMAQGRRLSGEPERLIRRALSLDANNLKVRALAGTVAFEQGRYDEAVAHWEQAVLLAPPNSNTARSLQSSLADARSRIGAPAPSDPAAPPVAAGSGTVSGRVGLAPALAGKVSPEDTVFIFARAPSGPRMPLAVLRKQVRDLPLDFVLDDRLAMNPNMRISAFDPVEVTARISRSGSPQPSPGDLEAPAVRVSLGSRSLDIQIDHTVQ